MKSITAAIISLVAIAAASPAQAALPVGATAPDFTTQASLAGKPIPFSLAAALKKGPVVLYFYPAAFTSGCTVEANEFAEATPAFQKMGATVVGVSADSIEKLNRFSVEACRNKFAVASADMKLINAYDVKLPVVSMSNRTTYVIAPDGKIAYVHSALAADGHVENALNAVKRWKAAN